MLACGVLTLVLSLVLAGTSSLPVAVVALVVVGGPAGFGSSMLYAHLRHSGAKPADIVNTRAIVSVAWIAGPPVATLIIGAFGNRAILRHRRHRRSCHRHHSRHDLAVVRCTRP